MVERRDGMRTSDLDCTLHPEVLIDHIDVYFGLYSAIKGVARQTMKVSAEIFQ